MLRRRALALAPLAALSSCLTGELWRGYSWPDPVTADERIATRTSLATGSLTPSVPVLENGLWWRGDEDHASDHWWLGAKLGDEAGAEFVDALLADPEFCQVAAASIDALRSCAWEDVLDDDACLQLQVCLRQAAIAEVVAADDVSPAAMRALAAPRRNAYLPAADPGFELPALCLRCAERLSSVDLRRFVDEPREVRAETWVFVDRDGRPLDASTLAMPSAANDERAPLTDRLAALRELSLLVRVHHGDRSSVLRVRPDRMWLLSGLAADGDGFTHRSLWHLQRRPMSLALPPASDAVRLASTLRLREDEYRHWTYPVLLDGKFLTKLALTPVTLALDILLGPGLDALLHGLTGPRRPDRGGQRVY